MAKRKNSKKQSQGVIYLIVLACLKTEYYYLYKVRKDLEDMFISLEKYEVCMQKVEWDKDGIPILGCPQRQDTLLRKPSGTPHANDD